MTQIEDIRYQHAGAAPQPMPALPFPSPPADETEGYSGWAPGTPGPELEELAPEPLTNGKAGFALVMSLLWLLGIGALLGVVFGIVAARECHRTGQPGGGMALAAVLLGLVGLVFSPPFLALL